MNSIEYLGSILASHRDRLASLIQGNEQVLFRICERWEDRINEAADLPDRDAFNTAFPQFTKLPLELRRRIWQYVIAVPRVVEFDQGPGDTGSVRYKYTPRSPPLFNTCIEARNEIIDTVSSVGAVLRRFGAAKPWRGFFPMQHIAYLRDLDFEQSGRGCLATMREWQNPEKFKHIEALVVNQDVLVSTLHKPASVIRKSFADLRVLVVLIQDTEDIKEKRIKYDPWLDFESDVELWRSYESDENLTRRRDMVQACNPPFKKVSKNMAYAVYVQEQWERSFGVEKLGYKTWRPPKVLVRGFEASSAIATTGRDTYQSDSDSDSDSDLEGDDDIEEQQGIQQMCIEPDAYSRRVVSMKTGKDRHLLI